MAVSDVPAVELATGRRSALDYPNIRRVDAAKVELADVPLPKLAMALFLIETIRRF